MYKLYGSPKTRAARVMWMLEEIGADYEIVPCGPHSPEVEALSPLGKIPVLVDGDAAIFDSVSIMTHLADKHDALTFPVGSAERARMNSILCFAVDDVDQPLWTLAKHGFVLPEELRRAKEIEPACRHEWERAMASLEKILGDGPFVMGEDFTVPDIVLGHLGGWAKATGFATPEGPVADYMTRVRARPGWRAVVEARKAA
ncbi:MAG: glutathione S-transferase family protein [Pseudomonadota bacterium]